MDLPFFTSSALDGFAVRATDVAQASPGSPAVLRIVGEARAGTPFRGTIKRGQAVEIMTGAPVPLGADTIVRVEDTELSSPQMVRIFAAPPCGTGVRPAGLDVRKEQKLLSKGEIFNPGVLGLLAGVGIGNVLVWPRPRVTIVTTGDELVDPVVEKLHPDSGRIFDSNSIILSALLKDMGCIDTAVRRAPDDPSALKELLSADAPHCDILLLSGGVSKGKYDYVRSVFRDLGGTEIFWGVNQQPGKPLFFGLLRSTAVFGLPGNPVSAYFCADIYVRTAVRHALGVNGPTPFEFLAIAGEDFEKGDSRTSFRRCILKAEGRKVFAFSAGRPDSNLIHTVTRHSGYLVIEPQRARLREGEPTACLIPEPARLWPEPLKALLLTLNVL